MGKTKYAVELLFGIGFKIGFMIVIISLIALYMPLIALTINPLLKYIGFWYVMDNNPQWVKVLTVGIMLMAAAAIISLLKKWFEPLLELLFFEDNYSKPKQF